MKLKLKGNLAKLVRAEEKSEWQLGGGVKGGSLTAEEMKRTWSVSAIYAGEMLDPSPLKQGFTDSTHTAQKLKVMNLLIDDDNN